MVSAWASVISRARGAPLTSSLRGTPTATISKGSVLPPTGAHIALHGSRFSGSPAMSLQMAGEVLVHLEHRYLVLAEDSPELVVGQYFTAVFRVLQVVQADVLPHLAHHLAPGQRVRADHRGELLRWL